MRLQTVKIVVGAAALLLLGGGAANAQLMPPFSITDWLAHRGGGDRLGSNGGIVAPPPLPPAKQGRIWVWPPTTDMTPEQWVDNAILPAPIFPVNGGGNVVPWSASIQAALMDRIFGVTPNNGTWVYPAVANRTQGAWPISDVTPDKVGDYVFAFARTNPVIAQLAKLDLDPNNPGAEGLLELQRLPNVSSDLQRDFINGKNFYKSVDDELQADTVYARWAFGRNYPGTPVSTFQGTRQLPDNTQLQAGERYAVYIRYPSSGTLIGGQPHPNADWVFVRVSWGDDVNDPHFSRIFMLNFGDTGAFWKRVRSSALEDRYFPYDGQHPITVTLYSWTISANNEFGISTIIPADSVRLVPESMRGDIHAPAASALFPPTAPLPIGPAKQLTYFGRDETTGPPNVATLAEAQTSISGVFTPTPFDPTKPSTDKGGANPLIDDQTSSVRSAVFYCFEDDNVKSNPPAAAPRYGKLRWRYVARSSPVSTTTIDNVVGPNFTAPAPWVAVAPGLDQSYGATGYFRTPGVAALTAPVTWTTNLTSTVLGTRYSVWAWIPSGGDTAVRYAHFAHYVITTADGPMNVLFDQMNSSETTVPITKVGMWRRIATGVRFPTPAPAAGVETSTATVTLGDDVTAQDVADGRFVAADALQFVAESQTPNSVAAAPLITNVKWPSGKDRKVVYFATTDGHVWCLDAVGVDQDPLTGVPLAVTTSSLTHAYWVYPSIDNPLPSIDSKGQNMDKNGDGKFSGPEDDPNYNPDNKNNVGLQGIDGDLDKAIVGANTVYTVNQISKAPALGPFTSSPMYVEVDQGGTRLPLIVVGNSNGRIYALSPSGRTFVDPMTMLDTGEPWPATFSVGDAAGVPGTTRRLMTWPTIGRDKWLDLGGLAFAPVNDKWALRFPDDTSKGSFRASLTAKLDAAVPPATDRVIAGAGDGHVYCVDLQFLNPTDRISNKPRKGAPRWLFPNTKLALGAITQTGLLTGTDKFVFTAGDLKAGGGRVYCIDDPATLNNGVANMTWVWPFTGTPGASPNKGVDKLPEETPFTSPAWKTGIPTLNLGNEVVFIANTDGRVFAFAADATGGAEPALLWKDKNNLPSTSFTLGSTRASVVFINSMRPQVRFPASAIAPPAILLALDTGDLVAFDANTGRQLWNFPDGNMGSVEMTTVGGVPGRQQFSTSHVWRGADIITANNWMYEGDEGIQDTGEVNGQMRAYSDVSIGQVTEGEGDVDAEQTSLDLRLVNAFNGAADAPPGFFDSFPGIGFIAPAHSPWNDRATARPNTQGNVLVYEWGDTIKVAAWGAMHYDPLNPNANILPTVHFRMTRTQSNEQQYVAQVDAVYAGPPLQMFPGDPDPTPVVGWVAKATFPLGRGSEIDAQTPGSTYQIQVYANFNSPFRSVTSNTLFLGQFDDPANAAGSTPYSPPAHTFEDTDIVGAPRNITLAHPLAVTVRGPFNEQPNPAAVPNIIGWTDNYPIDNVAGNLSELLKNGNYLADALTLARTGVKDVVAPVGMVGHGQSGLYQGLKDTGERVPAMYVADRSNLFKLGQPLNNVRVERTDMRWAWNPNTGNALQQATGNVMNPLPWENFPINNPNNSFDYPNIDRSQAIFRGNGIDMGSRGVTLPGPDVMTAPGLKILRPLQVDFQVDVPRFQPANVNLDYFDIVSAPVGFVVPVRLLAPMMLSTGSDPSGNGNIQLKQQITPSAGYVNQTYVFIDSNGNGRFENSNSPSATQQSVATGREEVYRQMAAAVAVSPDTQLRAEEETIDLGKQPHSAGFTPTIPFAPSGVGPYSVPLAFDFPIPFHSRWDEPPSTLFQPFTVQSIGNVNLIDLRVAKVIGDPTTTNPALIVNDPTFWLKLTSDQVEQSTGTGQIWGMPFNFLAGAGGAGNFGVVSSLDHQHLNLITPPFEINYNARYGAPNFWPWQAPGPLPLYPYVVAGNPLSVNQLDGYLWNTVGQQEAPTLHKALPGDSEGSILTIPDVAHGDPESYLSNFAHSPAFPTDRPVKPMIGLAVPLGTPAGTYSASVYIFEDHMPEQWRTWSAFYRNTVFPGTLNQTDIATDNDGVLNVQFAGAQTTPVEPSTNPTFKLKVTVEESRLTNGVTANAFNQIDIRRPDNLPFGANLQPAAMRDRTTGNLFMYWTSNRPNNFGPAPVTPDTPWYLFFSQLNDVTGPVPQFGPFFDWKYEPISGTLESWWNPLGVNAAFPAPPFVANNKNNFPSEAADIPMGTVAPVVPGIINPNTERHATPALTQDDDPAKNNPVTWLFWQGAVYKSEAGGQNFVLDTRTFYTPLQNGAPNPPAGIPYSFLNDPNLPKFSPRPIVLTTLGSQTRGYLFWHGGPQGRTRIYNNSTIDPTNVALWTRDQALATPGQLQSQSDPYPVHRIAYNANNQLVDAIDLYYTGLLSNHKQAETLMTRYEIAGNGRLSVMELPRIDNELMAREGATQTWGSRDLAWVYQVTLANGDRDFVDAGGVPPYIITLTRANGTVIPRVNLGRPTYDQATGRLYFDSALGGQLYVDPQGGTVTFTASAPLKTDRLTVTYTPQTLRVNVTRNDTGAIFANTPNPVPAGLVNDAGYALRPFVPSPGSNTGPVAFIDRSTNPKFIQNSNAQDPNPDVIIPGPAGGLPAQTARMWLIYRKTDSNVTSPAAIYYKTMRLMVRLPRGVVLTNGANRRTALANVIVVGNRGPVEIDWMRGRLYFTEVDEGNKVTVTFNYGRDMGGNLLTIGPVDYRVGWGDEISSATQPADQTTAETILPTDSTVNEGQISAFAEIETRGYPFPIFKRVWVFWSSTRNGTSDIYYIPINPQFYPIAGL